MQPVGYFRAIENQTSGGVAMDERLRHAPVETLKQRRDFLRIRGGQRWSCGTFVIEARKRNDTMLPHYPGPRIGYTVTKRIGNAVTRNRVKRRLRAAVASLEPGQLRNHHDYVLIARSGALKRAFVDLTNDLREGLSRIHHPKRNSRTRNARLNR